LLAEGPLEDFFPFEPLDRADPERLPALEAI